MIVDFSPLFKTINLNDLNEKVYEDTIFSREYKYDYIGNIFYPLNDTRLDKDENIMRNTLALAAETDEYIITHAGPARDENSKYEIGDN